MIRRCCLLSLFAVFVAACATDDPNVVPPSDDAAVNGGQTDAGADMASGNDATQDVGGEACADGDTRETACGLNDRGVLEEACDDEIWSATGDCDDPDVCVDEGAQEGLCGRNNRGAIPQTCIDGAWQNSGACTDPDECTDAALRIIACGLNDRGTQEQSCLAGAWDDSAACVDPDPCSDGAMRNLSCGLNFRGMREQTCLTGVWEDTGGCVDPDVCIDGGMQAVTCGLNDRGMQQQTCVAGGWVDMGTCAGIDVCTDGATQTVTCGFNGAGTQPQLCVVGVWQDDGACSDPDVCQNNSMQQVMCGFDGTQDQTCGGGQWIDVGGCVESVVSFCLTQPALTQSITGEASATIVGTVYVDQNTPGAGAAGGVIGELVWGPSGTAPSSWTNVEAASYFGDVDRLMAGDLANDVWHGTITAGSEADFDYAFRFSADNGSTWQLCDVNGTQDGNFDAGALGLLEARDPNLADNCKLQFPNVIEGAQIGQPIDFYGRVTEVGMTGMGSANANVVGELIVGPVGMDPRPDAVGFQTIGAMFNTSALNLSPNEDEYEVSFTPGAAGAFAFGFRFSVDAGQHWESCAMQDAAVSGPFDTNKMGWLNVTAAPAIVDFCHVWQDTLADDSNANSQPTVTVEIFHAGLTDSAAPATALVAEAAALPLEHNPAITAGQWNPLPFKGPRAGVPQNYEYEGTPYVAATHPPTGSYNVVVRVREAASASWTYCDTDDADPDFRLDAASRLTVSP